MRIHPILERKRHEDDDDDDYEDDDDDELTGCLIIHYWRYRLCCPLYVANQTGGA